MSSPIKRSTFRSMYYLLIATGLLLSLASALVNGQLLLPATSHSSGYHSSSGYSSSSSGSLVSQPAAGSTISRRTYTYVRPATRLQHSPSFVYHNNYNRHFHPFPLFSFHAHSQPQPFHLPYFRFGPPRVNYASAPPLQPATGANTIQYWPPSPVAPFSGSSLSPQPSSSSSSYSNAPASATSTSDSTLASPTAGRPSAPSSPVLSSGARPLYRRPSGVVASRPRPAVSVPAPSPTASSSSTSVITNSGDADIGFDAPVTSNSDSSSLAGPTVSVSETSGSNAPANSAGRATDNLEASAASI